MEKKQNLVKYFWQIIYANIIAYFIAGIFGYSVMNYTELWLNTVSSPSLSIDDPILALATFFHLFRGILIALVLLPLRKTFFEEKYGLLKLGLVMMGFSLISSFGAPWVTFLGYIYSQMPLKYQLTGFPEAILYVILFTVILLISKKYAHKKIITILSITFTILILLMFVMHYISLFSMY